MLRYRTVSNVSIMCEEKGKVFFQHTAIKISYLQPYTKFGSNILEDLWAKNDAQCFWVSNYRRKMREEFYVDAKVSFE